MQFLNDPFCTSLLTINIQKCLAYFLLPRISTLLYNISNVNINCFYYELLTENDNFPNNSCHLRMMVLVINVGTWHRDGAG